MEGFKTSSSRKMKNKAAFKERVEIGLLGVADLQTTLLCERISKSLTRCNIIDTIEELTPSHHLLLLDCRSVLVEDIPLLFADLQSLRPEIVAALLNAQGDTLASELISWPIFKGYFNISTPVQQLIQGLNEILTGGYWLPRQSINHYLDQFRQPQSSAFEQTSLTPREKQILHLMAPGLSNSQIANRLRISEHTVKSHIYHIYRKIGANNRLEALNRISTQQVQPLLEAGVI
ncbi:hypothetical protein DJ030_07355 [bacterium endosymbiont of Escarpia laminata]|nr:MAG: hypothetical protein DJ030_07355 [bacterium endosymbiont of Escarpia laminata]RLJ21847.1 MAG: hypothetical protein DJ031_02245 [bacterium endosymbiont of Escarpia laminata]